MSLDAWVGVLIATAPTLLLFVYLARAKRSMWIAFVVGAVGWTVAGFLRSPILTGIALTYGEAVVLTIPFIALSAAFAGLFEEGIKYVLMRRVERTRIDWTHVLSLGLGWGFSEAVQLYALTVLAIVYVQGTPLTLLELLPGALERNMAVLMHVAYSFVVFRGLSDVRYLGLAMALHGLVDFVVVTAYWILGLGVWYAEGMVLLMALALGYYAYRIAKGIQVSESEELHAVERKEGDW